MIAIQFYRPHKKIPQKDEKDFLVYENAPKQIETLFKKACYDCHSNHTDYQWYDNIAPFSWIVDKNIKRAKLSLNFSKWGDFEPWQRRVFLQGGIVYDINIDRMPPKRYLRFHHEAIFDDRAKEQIENWIKTLDFMKE